MTPLLPTLPSSRPRLALLLAALLAAPALLVPAGAEAQRRRGGQRAPAANSEPLKVDLHGSRYHEVGASISRVSVASPDRVDVEAVPPDKLLITGKRLGTTRITLWRGDSNVGVVTVVVGYPESEIVRLLREAIPDGEALAVETAGTALVLSGRVKDVADLERAERIARGFLPSPAEAARGDEGVVVNMLQVTGDQQVQLEVSFAEVSRTALREIGLNLWHRSPDNYTAGLFNPQTTPGQLHPQNPNVFDQGSRAGEVPPIGADNTPIVLPPSLGAFGAIFGLGNDHSFPFSAALSVLSQRGFARVLSEPTLVALNGHAARFVAGGEFPVPLPQALGQVVVEYKEFGVQLDFVPTIVDDTIQLKVDMIVSDLDFSLGIRLANVTVPGLTKRQSQTTVRLRDGESFAIAGLLSDKVRSSVDKVPWLGDLPILGVLFRSTRYRREETELLVVVTARRVRPTGDMPLLPGEDTRVDPSDLELFFLGTHESLPGGELPRRRGRKAAPGQPEGPVGFRRPRRPARSRLRPRRRKPRRSR